MEGSSPVRNLNQYRAEHLVEDGKHFISIGNFDRAIECFEKASELHPTAEGHTYWGWVLGLKGDLDTAIDHCLKAIKLDPNFGNPYNDIGSYLIQKNQLNAAIHWLEKANKAPHYDAKHFPYINLGRIYSVQGEVEKAIEAFNKALDYSPSHPEIQKVLEQLQELKNQTV